MNKPTYFGDLLNLQRILDKAIEKIRNNGFVPRKRNVLDILLAIDDEFQEWCRELPQEYNFKTWKQKEYSREKELEELTDILFFFLQYCNVAREIEKVSISTVFSFSGTEKTEFKSIETSLNYLISKFKFNLWNETKDFAFYDYMQIVYFRGFTKEDLLNTYWEKWQKNMTRINKDWILEGK